MPKFIATVRSTSANRQWEEPIEAISLEHAECMWSPPVISDERGHRIADEDEAELVSIRPA